MPARTTVTAISPTAAEKAAEPAIASFAVAPTEVDPGDVVALSWEASGARALARICPSARFVLFTPDDCWQVPLSGTATFTIPVETGGNRFVDFLLTVDAEGASEPVVWQTSVALKCDRTWFFSDEPQAGICPREPVRSRAAAQRFERGTMIWIEQPGRYVILEEALVHGDDRRKRVTYAQEPLQVDRDTSSGVVAPDGLYAPVGGFGLVWRGDVAGSSGYRDRLGWALAPAFAYDAVFQCDDALPSGGRSWQTCYLRGPDARVFVLDPLERWHLREGRHWSTALELVASRTTLTVGQVLTVTVSIRDDSVGCRFGAVDITLRQQGDDVFEIDSPKATSPGSRAVFTLTAVYSGTATLDAYAYGEHNCGFSDADWYWAGVGATSEPITVSGPGDEP
jgi:hypothetical protein